MENLKSFVPKKNLLTVVKFEIWNSLRILNVMSKQSVITYNLNEGTSTEYTHGIIYNSLSAPLLNSIKCIVLGMNHGDYIYLMYNIP